MAKPSLVEHPKFKRLLRRLQIPRPYLVGHLELLWRVANTISDPVIGDEMDVELAAEWQGQSGAFAEALEAERFLDRDEDGRFRIHDYEDHAPASYLARYVRPVGREKPPQWAKTRRRILIRDRWICRYCGDHANTVDHVVPRAAGGAHEDSNLVAACRGCNSRKGARTLFQAGLTLQEVH